MLYLQLHSREVLELLNSECKVLGIINHSVVVKDSTLANIPLIKFAPNHATTKGYIKVAKELFTICLRML